MTREEAKTYMMLYQLKLKASVNAFELNEDIKAFDMAIKALEQCEPCEDGISRKAVLKLFATHDGRYLYEAIRDMPSVEQEPKTGHWIKNKHTFWTCDICEFVNNYNRIKYNYCPNCGAKMNEIEIWNGIHGQIVAPKGIFHKIWEDAEKEGEEEC